MAAEYARAPAVAAMQPDDESWPASTLTLERPWLLLGYTDGLIEGRHRPGTTDRFGIERLVDAVTELAGQHPRPTELLDQLLATVQAANGGQLSDDVAIVCLAVRH